MLHNIPAELRARKQWVVATGLPNGDGKPCKVPLDPRTGLHADVTDPLTWGTWEDAEASPHRFKGYVLSGDDPYVIIDLDATDDPNLQARHAEIYEAFPTYAELSQSGSGAHIVCEGTILRNIKSAQFKIEVYHKDRYIIFTGDILKTMPVANCQPMLDRLVRTLDAKGARKEIELVQVDGSRTDAEILDMANNAKDGEKFRRVWEAADLDQPQANDSGDDFALMNLLHFYSQDYEQCRRMFRASGRGKRSKGQDQRYLDRMLRKLAAEKIPLVDITQLLLRSEKMKPSNLSTNLSPDDFPPGLIGDIAHYIFASAIKPVPEVALAAALAMMAGICGRSYNISDMGLNLYLILVAKTGCGKEGAAKAIGMLFNAVRTQVPAATDFRGPANFASGQALIRALDKQQCFVSVIGEFGLFLKRITDERANGNDTMLRAVILDLFSKGGRNDTLQPSAYSDTANNTNMVQSPCVTLFGETTPESLFDSLGMGAVSDGTLPRFSIIEYTGDRPPTNPRAFFLPPQELVDRIAETTKISLELKSKNQTNVVATSPEAALLLAAFDAEADGEHTKSTNQAAQEIWSRAHVKVLKLSALLAVGTNPVEPLIDADQVEWACRRVRGDIAKIQNRFLLGDIGSGDTKREAEVRKMFLEWDKFGHDAKRKYRATDKMLNAPVVPFYFLRQRLRQMACFRGHNRGSNQGLKDVLTAMVEAGELEEFNIIQRQADYDTKAPLYGKGPNFTL